MADLQKLVICIKGAGEMASGIGVRLHRAGFHRLLMLEREQPLAVRRMVCFSEAVHDGEARVEEIVGRRISSLRAISTVWKNGEIGVYVDPAWECLAELAPDVVIDATLAKKNLGTSCGDAPLVIGLGPGFTAGVDVHVVVETMRGHYLGRVIWAGSGIPDTGIPGEIGGFTVERILRAPASGTLETTFAIGDRIAKGSLVGTVGGKPLYAEINGVIRGLIRADTPVARSVKIGDIDPRGESSLKALVSDKALAVGGGVLEAVLGFFLGGREGGLAG